MFEIVINHFVMHNTHYICTVYSTMFLLKINIFLSCKFTNKSRTILPIIPTMVKIQVTPHKKYTSFPFSKASSIYSIPFNFPGNFYFFTNTFSSTWYC